MLKKIFSSVCFGVIFSVIFFSSQVEAAKKTVAVMPLENMSGYNEQLVAEIMAEQLVIAIQDSGQYTVVERQKLDSVFKELGFQNLSADPEYTVEMGKMFGAQYVVIGKITMAKTEEVQKKSFIQKIKGLFNDPFKSQISMDLRFIDCKTGVINLAKTIVGENGGKDAKLALHNACKDAAIKFMQEIQAANPLIGRILNVTGNEIYIDQGIDSGLHKDEVLVIAREGSPLESNGQIIGMTQTVIGKAKVVEVTEKYSVCKILESSLAVEKGDIVKRGN